MILTVSRYVSLQKPDLTKISLSNGFEPHKITEAYEEPASLYCVFARKEKAQ